MLKKNVQKKKKGETQGLGRGENFSDLELDGSRNFFFSTVVVVAGNCTFEAIVFLGPFGLCLGLDLRQFCGANLSAT